MFRTSAISLFSAITALLGCSGSSVPPENTPEPLTGDVTMAVSTIVLSDRRVRVEGTSNLPEETNLLVTVAETVPGSIGQSPCKVSANGAFQAEAIGPVEDGVYLAEVVMPVANVQPPVVQRLIGANGERLKGPLVEDAGFGRVVKVAKRLVIGGAQAIPRELTRAEQQSKKCHEWVERLTALDKRFTAERAKGSVQNDTSPFVRQFRNDLAVLNEKLWEEERTPIRSYIGIPLQDLAMLLDAEIASKDAEYRKADAAFHKDVADLQALIEQLHAEADELKRSMRKTSPH
jgi:hypothetical protein